MQLYCCGRNKIPVAHVAHWDRLPTTSFTEDFHLQPKPRSNPSTSRIEHVFHVRDAHGSQKMYAA